MLTALLKQLAGWSSSGSHGSSLVVWLKSRIRQIADAVEFQNLENTRMGWALLHIAKLKLQR